MIQAVNSVNTNAYKKQNTSFGNKAPAEQADYRPEEMAHKKPSKAKRVFSYAAGQFAAGAIVSGLLNIGGNIVEKLKKVPDKTKLISASNIAKQAALMGGIFVLMGLVIDGVFSFMYRRKDK